MDEVDRMVVILIFWRRTGIGELPTVIENFGAAAVELTVCRRLRG